MKSLGRAWKAATRGQKSGMPDQAVSTIPRDVTSPRLSTHIKSSEPAEVIPSETRSAERFVPSKSATVLTTLSGKRVSARIINVSRAGVAVEAEVSSVDLDQIVFVGSQPVKPARRIALGMVFRFVKELDPRLCGPHVVL